MKNIDHMGCALLDWSNRNISFVVNVLNISQHKKKYDQLVIKYP